MFTGPFSRLSGEEIVSFGKAVQRTSTKSLQKVVSLLESIRFFDVSGSAGAAIPFARVSKENLGFFLPTIVWYHLINWHQHYQNRFKMPGIRLSLD